MQLLNGNPKLASKPLDSTSQARNGEGLAFFDVEYSMSNLVIGSMNSPHSKEWTPLHFAAMYGEQQV